MSNLSYAAKKPAQNKFTSVERSFCCVVAGFGLFLSGGQAALGQTSAAPHTFAIAGHAGTAPVVQIGGKSYVSIEDITRLAQGSLSFHTDQIVLSLTAPSIDSAPVAAPPRQGFSRDFLTAAIEAMAVMRELRIEIADAIKNNYPISADWIADQSRKAETDLALVSTAITTDDDHSAFSLLTGQYGNVKRFRDKYLAAKSEARYIDPSSVDSNPLNQQIMNCTHALQAMAAQNKYWDDLSCH